jgi:hypothetical protein
VPGAGAVDSPRDAPTAVVHPIADVAGAVDGVVDNFSPGERVTLCWAKVFGIIVLSTAAVRLSTARSPVSD